GLDPYSQPNSGYGNTQGYGAPPQPYPNYNMQGVNSDWQNYQQPAGGSPQGPPPVSYTAPQPQYSQPQVASPPPQGGAGNYSAIGQPQQFDQDLPAGAVRITTQTPDGTTIQYYPPQGGDDENQVVPGKKPVQRQGRLPAKQARAKKQPQTSTTTTGIHEGNNSIAMPHPVEIPRGQDPRTGWGSFGGEIPVAPPTQ
ncbi:MAG: hypothetical protein ACP5VS_12525, partial [Desulfomonilaceae bacterium]